MTELLSGFVLGVFTLLGYVIWRMLRSDGWDTSNILNALRLISHVAAHPEDFQYLWYVSQNGRPTRRPFAYIAYDEFKHNMPSRPLAGEKTYHDTDGSV